jgi:hypothetical protein
MRKVTEEYPPEVVMGLLHTIRLLRGDFNGFWRLRISVGMWLVWHRGRFGYAFARALHPNEQRPLVGDPVFGRAVVASRRLIFAG